MKKIILCSIVVCSIIFASEIIDNEGKGCIENLESEVVKIVNSNIEHKDKQKAIEALKTKVEINAEDNCEEGFEADIKKIVFGNNKVKPSKVIAQHAKKLKKNPESINMNTQDCIDNFEAEVFKIISSNPKNKDLASTKKIMHDIMHDKVVESCESEFEKDTKKIVNKK